MNDSVISTASDPVRLESPEDLLAATPYFLGYHPSDSLAVVGLVGAAVRVTCRYDLAAPGHAGDRDVRSLAQNLRRRGIGAVLLVGYGPPERVTPDMDAMRRAMAEASIPVLEALRVTDGRYWSYTCGRTGCCPAEGTRFDPAANRVAAELTYHGMTALPDRAELAALIAPVEGATRDEVIAETTRAVDRLADELLHSGDTAGCWDRWRDEGTALVREVVRHSLDEAEFPSGARLARLTVMLSHGRIRDEAWAETDEQPVGALIPLWTHVLRHADPVYAAGPAVLLAYAAFRDGNGALARIAVERALEFDPENRVALMLGAALDSGAVPAELPPITREWIAERYREGEGDAVGTSLESPA